MDAVALGPKSFQEIVFKAFVNLERSGYVERQQVRLIDRILCSLNESYSFLGDNNNCE